MNNIEEERSPGYISESQAPPFDPTANTGLMAVGQVGEKVDTLEELLDYQTIFMENNIKSVEEEWLL